MKSKYLNLIVIVLVLLFLLNAIPAVLGKSRKSYLIDFIYSNEIEGFGFSDSNENGETVSYEATAYALYLLDSSGRNPHETSLLTDNLKENITEIFNEENFIYDLYFLLKSLEILEEEVSIDADLKDTISEYLNQTEQEGGGFSVSNTSTYASLSTTYFAIRIFSLINESVTIDKNVTKHKNWVLSCSNSDGGYGGNSSLSSTLLSTYYAVSILTELGFTIYDLVDYNQTLDYFKSFYVNDTSDIDNYGGYLPDELAIDAHLSSTFYCVNKIDLINPQELHKSPTVSWVIDRQNFIDGGFVDTIAGDEQKLSSIVSSYFAFEILKAFDSLSELNKDIWMVEFNLWILIAVLGSIGFAIVLIYVIWRKRRI
ncbi:MAG: prenyltransferase/squalene oxidase repeat-containing protein [Candidatus Hodarchaeota archaeon]